MKQQISAALCNYVRGCRYALPGMQQELARQVAAVGTPVVVVEVSGMAVGMDFIAQQSHWPLIVGGYGGRFAPVCLAPCLTAVQSAHWYSHSTNRSLKEPQCP